MFVLVRLFSVQCHDKSLADNLDEIKICFASLFLSVQSVVGLLHFPEARHNIMAVEGYERVKMLISYMYLNSKDVTGFRRDKSMSSKESPHDLLSSTRSHFPQFHYTPKGSFHGCFQRW